MHQKMKNNQRFQNHGDHYDGGDDPRDSKSNNSTNKII